MSLSDRLELFVKNNLEYLCTYSTRRRERMSSAARRSSSAYRVAWIRRHRVETVYNEAHNKEVFDKMLIGLTAQFEMHSDHRREKDCTTVHSMDAQLNGVRSSSLVS